ncbi:MAG TPA: substrate-binding domain-containing protein [Vicinamibacteria bacterium]|nr:substrate-binding domain-containing protein [Vicinamibacteria bacterium]
MADGRTVFVLLPGRKEEQDHYQLLQEQTALAAGKRHGFAVEIAWAPAFDQLRVLRKRLLEPSPVHALVFEPSNVSTVDLVLRERTGLVMLNAWSPSVEKAAASWPKELPFGTISTDHAAIGRIQGEQLRRLVTEGSVLCVTGPRRSSAAQDRLQALREAVGTACDIADAEAGDWTEAAGIIAFGDWYRIFKSRNPKLAAVAAQADELAMGVRSAIAALPDASHRATLTAAKLFGVDACPGYGMRLVDEGQLTASVVNPANTGQALDLLNDFWTSGRPLPLRSFTAPSPYPATR